MQLLILASSPDNSFTKSQNDRPNKRIEETKHRGNYGNGDVWLNLRIG